MPNPNGSIPPNPPRAQMRDFLSSHRNDAPAHAPPIDPARRHPHISSIDSVFELGTAPKPLIPNGSISSDPPHVTHDFLSSHRKLAPAHSTPHLARQTTATTSDDLATDLGTPSNPKSCLEELSKLTQASSAITAVDWLSPTPCSGNRRRVHFELDDEGPPGLVPGSDSDESDDDDLIDPPHAHHTAARADLAEHANSPAHPDLERRYTYGHYCCGLHSLHHSWEPIGLQCKFTCEADEDLAKIAHGLNGIECFSDLETAHLNDYPPVSVAIGGTPCPTFSENGYKDGLDQPSGALFVTFGELHGKRPWLLRPIFSIHEIVYGVVKTHNGEPLRKLHRALEHSGYVVYDYVLQALDYGALASRLRIYIIGIRRDVFEILGPLPTPPTTPRDPIPQAARNALADESEDGERHDASRFSPVIREEPTSDVYPKLIFVTADGDQNGNVYSIDHPAPCLRALDSPGIEPFGIYWREATDRRPAYFFSPSIQQALKLQSLPTSTPNTGKRSIGNSFNGRLSAVIGTEVKAYLARWYSFLENGHSDNTRMQCLTTEAQAFFSDGHGIDVPRAPRCLPTCFADFVWWLVDSGCTYSIVIDISRVRNPRQCNIPIKIGDGKFMHAEWFGDGDITTLTSDDEPYPLKSRLTLVVPLATRNLLSQERVIKDNDFALVIPRGGIGERVFHDDTTRIPISIQNGLSVIPVAPLVAANSASMDQPHGPDRDPTPDQSVPAHSHPATSPIVSSHTSTTGAFTANVERDSDLCPTLSSDPDVTNYQGSRSNLAMPLAQISTRLGTSVSWIHKAATAKFPGAIIEGRTALSDADAARDAMLASASGQQRKSASHDARDARQPSRVGSFSCDYVGPFAVPTLEGATGCHEFLELATGFAAVVLCTSKGDFAVVLRRVLIRFVYPFIAAMLCLTCDCALEYGWGSSGCHELKRFCLAAFIKLRYNAPYTPNHNDTERLHKTLTRIMLRLMIQAGAPEPFWGLARLMALEIYLCMPSERALRHKGYVCSPRHAYTSAPEDLSHIHPFMCLCHVLNDSATITMRHLQRHGTAALMVGVGRTEGVEYYAVWCPNENLLRQTRNVRFHDRVFPLMDGSLLWDPSANRGTWRFPLYGHLEPLNPGRASSLRLNPHIAPSSGDPFSRVATQRCEYDWLRPTPATIRQPNAPTPPKRRRVSAGFGPPAPPIAADAPVTEDATTGAVHQPRQPRGSVPCGDGVTTLDRLLQSHARIEISDTAHKTPGSKSNDRFLLYKHSGTVNELLQNGATRADVAHDIRAGLVRIADTGVHALLMEHIDDWDAHLMRAELTDPAGLFSDLDRHHVAAFNNAHAYAAARLQTIPSEKLLRAIADSSGSRLVSHRQLAVEYLMANPTETDTTDRSPLAAPERHVEAWPMLARPRPLADRTSLSASSLDGAVQSFSASMDLGGT